MNKKLVLMCASLAFLAGCSCRDGDLACNTERETSRPTAYVTPQSAPSSPLQTDRRVIVERIDVVADSLAYGGARGVYVIRDTKTGQEFIGVSGIGISETGSHQSGKTQRTDER